MLQQFAQWVPLGLPAFLFVISVVVFFHELGHFLMGRACGVAVEVFSIGFGPEIFGWTDRRGTRWKVSWLPFGGYVKFLGDENAAGAPDREGIARMDAHARGRALPLKPLWQRALVVAAGPFANFILAIVIFAACFMVVGDLTIPPVVGSVHAHSPAEAAGIRKGDTVLAVNGAAIRDFTQIAEIVTLSNGQDLAITVERAGHRLTLHARPRMLSTKDVFGNTVTMPMLGIGSDPAIPAKLVRMGPLQALGAGVGQTWSVVHDTLDYVWQMLSGRMDTSQLQGPIGMAKVSRQAASMGFFTLVNLAALISVSIGLINLFPIPLLDGGHLLYYACEAVLGHPLGERAQDVGFRLGLAAVLGLMLLATWNDLSRLNVF